MRGIGHNERLKRLARRAGYEQALAVSSGGPVRIKDLDPKIHCRWLLPAQAERHSLYCGQPLVRGSFCAEHAIRAYAAKVTG